jgi:hypothetical protein
VDELIAKLYTISDSISAKTFYKELRSMVTPLLNQPATLDVLTPILSLLAQVTKMNILVLNIKFCSTHTYMRTCIKDRQREIV